MNAQVKFSSNVYEIKTTVKADYKIVSLSDLIQALRVAYVAACKSVGLANKLKASYPAQAKRKSLQKSRTMSLKNKIAKELNYYDTNGLSLFESVAYRGVLINKF